jgi:hypothetical protein
MPYNPRHLGVVAYSNGTTLWEYLAEDAAAARDPDFWHAAADLVRGGDRIMVRYQDASGDWHGQTLFVARHKWDQAAGERVVCVVKAR